MSRCIARTKDLERCANHAEKGSLFCRRHRWWWAITLFGGIIAITTIGANISQIFGVTVLNPFTETVTFTITDSPTPMITQILMPTTTQTATGTPRPTPSSVQVLSNDKEDITIFATVDGTGQCASPVTNSYVTEKSILDIGINNNSNRTMLFTSVKMIPGDLFSDVVHTAGGTPPTSKYFVSISSWVQSRRSFDNYIFPTPEPISASEMLSEKFSVLPHTLERFQIVLGFGSVRAGDIIFLQGDIRLEITLDNGMVLRTDPFEIIVCNLVRSW